MGEAARGEVAAAVWAQDVDPTWQKVATPCGARPDVVADVRGGSVHSHDGGLHQTSELRKESLSKSRMQERKRRGGTQVNNDSVYATSTTVCAHVSV